MKKYIITEEKINGITQVLFDLNVGAKTLQAIVTTLKEVDFAGVETPK